MIFHERQLPGHQQDILDRFMAACQADDRIVAAFLGGSHASGEIDQFSDLDLFFITTDDAYQDFLKERERFIRLLGEPLLMEDFGVSHGCCVIFSNSTEADIWFGHESQYKEINSGPVKVLLDKKGVLDGEPFPAQPADPDSQIELLRQQMDWFWHDLSHFIKAMGREQLWFAYGQIEALRQMCVTLARLRHNFSDAYIGGEPYFKVEERMPIEELAPLQTTFCAMEHGAMIQAALVICGFFQDIAPGLAAAHNLPYRADLERMMLGKLNGLRRGGERG